MTSTPRHGYLARNPALLAWLRFADAVLRRTARVAPRPAPEAPRRILVGVGGHYGDAVIASAALDALARAFPGAELGVMAGRAGLTVLAGLPRVRWTHRCEHWRIDRAGGALPARWLRAARVRRRALRELRAVGYDAAVDLSAHYPNMVPLMWRARIPYRLGFTSGGFGALLTDPVPWAVGAMHEVERQRTLLARLTARVNEGPPRYRLPVPTRAERERAEGALAGAGVTPAVETRGYVVLHTGAGDPHKAWPLARWSALAARLADEGWAVVLTGAGGDEERAAREVASAVASADAGGGTGARVVNLAGRLDWGGLVHLVSRARLVASGDTAVAHVAAACEVPCVVAFTGRDRPERWRPWGDRVEGLVAADTGNAGRHARPGAAAGASRYVAADDRRIRVVRELGVDEMHASIAAMLGGRRAREEHDGAR